jgi:hypothetical protein
MGGGIPLLPYLPSWCGQGQLYFLFFIQGDQNVSVHLMMATTEYIRNVDRVILNTVFENTVRRVNKCLETDGGHFEQYL